MGTHRETNRSHSTSDPLATSPESARTERFDAHAQQQETAGREAKPKPRHGFRGDEEASLCAPAGCTSSGALAGHRVCMRGLAEGRDHLHPAPPPKACVAYSIARDAVARAPVIQLGDDPGGSLGRGARGFGALKSA